MKNITHLTPPKFQTRNGIEIIVQYTDRAELKEIINGKGSKFGELSFIDLDNPFWQGYVAHLVGDKIVYNTPDCVNMTKYIEDCKDPSIGAEIARKRLHKDWDCINKYLQDTFGIDILPHIEEKGVVRYIDGVPTYVNENALMKAIDTVKEITSEMNMKSIVEKVDAYFAKIQPVNEEVNKGEDQK